MVYYQLKLYFCLIALPVFCVLAGSFGNEYWVIELYSFSFSLCQYLELFWSVFSGIQTKYGETRIISSCSVRMQKNVDQNNSNYGHFTCSGILRQNSLFCQNLSEGKYLWMFFLFIWKHFMSEQPVYCLYFAQR